MATQDFETLRARVQALGYTLYGTADGVQLVVEAGDPPTVVFIHESDVDDELEDWIATQEADEQPEPAKPPSVVRQYDHVSDRLRAIKSVAHLLSCDPNLDEVITNAASHVWDLSKQAEDELTLLLTAYRAELAEAREPQARRGDEPREWTGASLDVEHKALGTRIVALPIKSVQELMYFCMNVVSARNGRDGLTIDEIQSLLSRDIAPEHVNAFQWLKQKGVAQITSATAGAGVQS